MKKILFVLVFAVAANAQIMLENLQCNLEGNPANSCAVSFSHFGFGQNFGYSAQSPDMFFFDASAFSVSKSALPSSANVPSDALNPTLPIRFFIYSNSQGYNSAMSLIHTAYSSRATVNVIFMNPAVNLLKNEASYRANTSKHYCFVNYMDNGKPASILCPILSIALLEN